MPGESDPCATASLEDLHKHFRSLMTLTPLVTAINTIGRPIGLKRSEQRQRDVQLPTKNVVLNSLASLLVRDSGVIVIASYDPPAVSADSMHLIAMEGLPWYNGGQSSSVAQSVLGSVDGESMLVTDSGISHLSHIDSWDYNLNLHKDPLQNHIATVEEYLAKYKLQRTVKGRRGSFFHFAKYMVAQCWKKMCRRIAHPSSQGFIYALGRVSADNLRDRYRFLSESKTARLHSRNDSALGRLLVGMADEGQIESIIMQPCGHPELSSDLTHIIAIFREMQLQSSADVPNDGLIQNVYNEDTCWEFHLLLLATILAYGKALVSLAEVDEAIQPAPKRWRRGEKVLKPVDLDDLKQDRQKYAKSVMLCGIVLWRLAHSGMLRQHLAVLTKGILLNVPIIGEQQIARYQWYTGFSWHNPHVQAENCVEDGESGCVDEMADYVGREEEDELLDIKDESGKSVEMLYRKWLHLQVTHWTALDAVSVHANSAAAPRLLKISLIAAARHNANEDFQVEPWKTTVGVVLAKGSVNSSINTNIPKANAVIDTIIKHTTMAKGMPRWPNTIFYAFQNNTERAKFRGNVHCEIALAALKKYALESQPESVRALLQNLNQSMVALSERSCPVCWELLNIIRGDADDFHVRGCHTTIHPVELPHCLPREAVEKMVIRFQKILFSEIVDMMSGQKPAEPTSGPYARLSRQ